MLDFSEAIEIAKDFFHIKGNLKFTKVYETNNAWIVFAGKENQVEYGSLGISIDKTTGTVSQFALPNQANFEILKKAKIIEI